MRPFPLIGYVYGRNYKMLDFKLLDGAMPERTQYMARTDADVRFLINKTPEQSYLTVGHGGFTKLECRVVIDDMPLAVALASAVEEYINGAVLGEGDEYDKDGVILHGTRTETQERTEDGLTYKIVEYKGLNGQLLRASLHIFKDGGKSTPLLHGKFKTLKMAKHAARSMAVHLQG